MLTCNHMIRTQIQLTEEQASALRAMSSTRHMPMAELIRIGIDNFLRREAGSSREAIVARAKNAAGRFTSGTSDVSTEHDKYLADAFGGQ